MNAVDVTPPASLAEDTSRAIRALREAAAHVERTIARALEPHSLTPAQFATLQVLHEAEHEALGCSELGQRLAGPAPDVTRMLDRLETVGLVSRERSETDRRQVHTRISSAGVNLVLAATPSVQDAENQALAGVAASDRGALTALLKSIRKNCPASA